MYLARETFLWNPFSCLLWHHPALLSKREETREREMVGFLVKVLENNTACLFLTTKSAWKILILLIFTGSDGIPSEDGHFIGVVKYDGVINGGTVTPHACFNFVVAPSRSWSKRSLVWMYVLSTSQTQNRGLERHCRDPGIDRTTVVRDSEKRKICGIWRLLGKQDSPKSWHGMRY